MIARVVLREFAKNSRILPRLRPAQIELYNFFFPRKSMFRNFAGIRYANASPMKGISTS
jgi:hypothetical protein